MAQDSLTMDTKVVTKPFLFLAALALIGVSLMLYRYIAGLGAVTNLSDGYPWGLWITYDVLIGTALGCGGYAMAILVYVLNRWEYHPVVRSAVLTSVFGYSLAGLAIFLDIGRYWNGYKLFLPWQVNFSSVLVEVALCIAAYVVVLWIELLPTILEGYPQNAKAVATRQRLAQVASGHCRGGHPAAHHAPIIPGDAHDHRRLQALALMADKPAAAFLPALGRSHGLCGDRL